AIAAAALVALAVFAVPFPAVIACAAVIGWALGRWAPSVIHRSPAAASSQDRPAPLIADDHLRDEPPSRGRLVKILGIGVLVWAVPVVAVAVLTGPRSTLTTQGMFFSGTALITFGGAYAVLAYVAQQAVDIYGWLSAKDMIRGLALAETTPGPLIMVVQFVAFLGAYHHPGPLNPWIAAVLGSVLTTWVTFVPSFLFILLGASYVERLRGNRALSAALTGITAAVVGVIANLGVYFAVHTLFATSTTYTWGPVRLDLPELASIRPVTATIAVVAIGLVFALRWSVLRTLGACAALGLCAALIGLPLG
ncbi:chromate transporter, partial [Micromonospora sp. KC207]|uniref:chromate transporter n=1 Tax=Micromonospora sp. KC207 TaxID=2530377 RepID=UPI00104AAACA